MTEKAEITQIQEDELLEGPTPHRLATGINVYVFNLKINTKTASLKTGNEFEFGGEFYEVMNRYQVQARTDYFKMNGLKKLRLQGSGEV